MRQVDTVPTAPATWNELALRRWQGSDELAVVTDETRWSGDELLQRAAGASLALDRLDLARGSAVPALMDETPTSIAYTIGAAMSGRALAPLGTKLTAAELAAMVRGLQTPILLTSPDRAALAAEVGRLADVTVDVIEHEPRLDEPLTGECRPDDVLAIVHTSGTTGAGKPVFVRQRPMAERVAIYESVMGLGPGDRYCSASPFHHTAGISMVFTVLGIGMGVIPQDWFSIEGWRRAARLGVTCALLVPTMIDILLAEGALDDAAPRVLQYGASPIDTGTLTEALAVLPDTRFLQIFGQTEVSPVSFLSHEDHLRALDGRPDLLASVGRAVPGAELRVENPDADGIGEIAIHAAHAFTTDPDGWRRTGDLGRIDDEGFVTLRGRVNDRIIRGGENIYPAEIEAVLLADHRVREVAVVGVPDRRWGEVVKAVIVPADAAHPPLEADIRELVAAELAAFKVPESVEFRGELPRTATGKVLRRALQ